MAQGAISIENLETSISGESVLTDLSLDVDDGEFCVIVGPSGCGKSTLLRSIAGLTEPDAGTVRLRGADASSTSPTERSLGFVFQEFEETLFPHMTVAENVAFGLEQQSEDYTTAEIDERVDEVLELLAISHTKDDTPDELSGGQQQRVELARQLVRECDIMLLDDPLADLDYKLQKRLELEIHRIQRERGNTFLYVTHNQDQALKLADTIAVMNRGQIEQIGTPEEIYSEPTNAFVARFIGDSNLFVSDVQNKLDSGIVVETDIGELTTTSMESESALSDDRGVTIVRPEHVQLGDGAQDCANRFTGRLESQTYSGEYTEYRVSVEGHDRDLMAVDSGQPTYDAVGREIEVGWERDAAYYFESLSVTGEVSIDDLEVI
jgi:ABC-type Fe3+/spermidine/putrescine transport system ATPase subunit